jgi:hypothetical protein
MESEEIVQIILAEGVNQTPNGGNMIEAAINPVLVFNSPVIPSALSFSIIIIMSMMDFSDEKNILVELFDDNKKLVYSSGVAKAKSPIKAKAPNVRAILNLHNVLFNKEGKYFVRLTINGEIKSELAFMVLDQRNAKSI